MNSKDPLLCRVDCAYWPDFAEIWPLKQDDRLKSPIKALNSAGCGVERLKCYGLF
jgi:hypothetical protein